MVQRFRRSDDRRKSKLEHFNIPTDLALHGEEAFLLIGNAYGCTHIRDAERRSDLRPDLRRIAVDGLLPAENEIECSQLLDRLSQRVARRKSIRAAKCAVRHEVYFISAHSDRILQDSGCLRGTHSDDRHRAAHFIAQRKCRFQRMEIQRIHDAVRIISFQSSCSRIDFHLRCVDDLFDTNQKLHSVSLL